MLTHMHAKHPLSAGVFVVHYRGSMQYVRHHTHQECDAMPIEQQTLRILRSYRYHPERLALFWQYRGLRQNPWHR